MRFATDRFLAERRNAMLGLAALCAAPFAAHAQSSLKTPRIGYLAFRSAIPSSDNSFLRGLAELGWVEGRNIFVDRRFAGGNADILRESAAELVRLKVDVIVAAASASAKTAKEATDAIPIVFANAGDPVGQGLVQSLSRPGANLTGVSFDVGSEIVAKQVQLLMELVPKISRVAVLWNSASAFLRSYWTALKAAAPNLRLALQSVEIREQHEFERAFISMARERADGLIVLSDTFATFHRGRIAELAIKNRLPAVFQHGLYVQAGGLMSYGPSNAAAYHRAAYFVDRILKGARPADLPVEQPSKFELVINAKTAKALGISIPQSILFQADEVIK